MAACRRQPARPPMRTARRRPPPRPWGGLSWLKKHKNRIASHRIAEIFRIFAPPNSIAYGQVLVLLSPTGQGEPLAVHHTAHLVGPFGADAQDPPGLAQVEV